MAFPMQKRINPSGEKKDEFRVNFSSKIKLMFQGARLSSNGGLLFYRDLDHALQLTSTLARQLHDPRAGSNISHPMVALLYQSIYSRLAHYEDINDADILKQDPIIRHIVGGRAVTKQAAASSEMHWFETHCLTQNENFAILNEALGRGVLAAHKHRKSFRKIIFDMDSSVSEAYGHQEGAEYNGYFKTTCYHPLFCFNQFGDLEGVMLRNGSVYSPTDWEKQFVPIIERYRDSELEKYYRGDAAFAQPGIYVTLEQEGYHYAIRLKENPRLMATISKYLTRPVGRPSNTPTVIYHCFSYQAESWEKARRVVAKIEWHKDELFPRVGFIVTNLSRAAKNVVQFYNQRGTCEQWIKEGKHALKWTKLSCKRMRANAVRLLLFGLAYNLANYIRTLVLPYSMRHWSLTTLLNKLIKVGARMIHHARYCVFQLAELCISKKQFRALVCNLSKLAIDTS